MFLHSPAPKPSPYISFYHLFLTPHTANEITLSQELSNDLKGYLTQKAACLAFLTGTQNKIF